MACICNWTTVGNTTKMPPTIHDMVPRTVSAVPVFSPINAETTALKNTSMTLSKAPAPTTCAPAFAPSVYRQRTKIDARSKPELSKATRRASTRMTLC